MGISLSLYIYIHVHLDRSSCIPYVYIYIHPKIYGNLCLSELLRLGILHPTRSTICRQLGAQTWHPRRRVSGDDMDKVMGFTVENDCFTMENDGLTVENEGFTVENQENDGFTEPGPKLPSSGAG